jgi:hypothetical protein
MLRAGLAALKVLRMIEACFGRRESNSRFSVVALLYVVLASMAAWQAIKEDTR